jgi:predicted AAA+ superfamily ATPase
MKIERNLDIKTALEKKSLFLFGPRQTGKTTLIKNQLSQYFFIQLLDATLQRRFIEDPSLLLRMIPEKTKYVIIDEIQKVPALLDIVHLLIEEKKIHFLLTGSSARKLKKSGVNLLGGRARTKRLYPLTYNELKHHFDLEKIINFGSLPSIYFSDEPFEDLKSYVSEYLIQEIAAEGITRNLPAFSRFLTVAALSNGQIINYTQIGSDAGVKRGTVQNYYEILEDTLIGTRLPAWRKSKTRKNIEADKFYLFDPGVVNALCERKYVSLKTTDAGFLFETFILNELKAWNEYNNKGVTLSYWKSTSNFEVDFIIDDYFAIEVKAKNNVNERDMKGLRAILEEKSIKKAVCIYLGDETLVFDEIIAYPYKIFLDHLWSNNI